MFLYVVAICHFAREEGTLLLRVYLVCMCICLDEEEVVWFKMTHQLEKCTLYFGDSWESPIAAVDVFHLFLHAYTLSLH